jgi:hypothetical protein
MEPEDSLRCSQDPSIGTYPEPDESSPNSHPISLRSILILPSHLRLRLPSGVCLPNQNPVRTFLLPMLATFPA